MISNISNYEIRIGNDHMDGYLILYRREKIKERGRKGICIYETVFMYSHFPFNYTSDFFPYFHFTGLDIISIN